MISPIFSNNGGALPGTPEARLSVDTYDFPILTVPNPGAGNDVWMTVPHGIAFIPLSFILTFNTSATVANRYFLMQFYRNALPVGGAVHGTAITASLAATVYGGPGMAYANATSGSNMYLTIPFAPIEMISGDQIFFTALAKETGDSFVSVRISGKARKL